MSIAEKLNTIADNTVKVYNAGHDVGYEKGKAEVIPAKEEQEKTVNITGNGTTEVLPDENKTLSKVTVNVNVPSSDYTDELIRKYIERSNPYNLFEEFTIPYGTVRIGAFAFASCTELKILNIPDTVKSIGENAFATCYALTIDLPDVINRIGKRAFVSNGHQIITKLPTELINIEDAAFQYCGSPFTLSEIPAKVETIGKQAFQQCTGFTELNFKGTPTSIATNAFQGCTNLLNIYVPWSEGEVANAPWSATNATIHYNSEV